MPLSWNSVHTVHGMSVPLDINHAPAGELKEPVELIKSVLLRIEPDHHLGCTWNLEVNSSRKVALTAISMEYGISTAAPRDNPGILLPSASNSLATVVGSLQV
jgi:hypothetical protein